MMIIFLANPTVNEDQVEKNILTTHNYSKISSEISPSATLVTEPVIVIKKRSPN